MTQVHTMAHTSPGRKPIRRQASTGALWVTQVLGGVAATIAFARACRRPIQAERLTPVRRALIVGTLAATCLLVFLPTWWAATHANF